MLNYVNLNNRAELSLAPAIMMTDHRGVRRFYDPTTRRVYDSNYHHALWLRIEEPTHPPRMSIESMEEVVLGLQRSLDIAQEIIQDLKDELRSCGRHGRRPLYNVDHDHTYKTRREPRKGALGFHPVPFVPPNTRQREQRTMIKQPSLPSPTVIHGTVMEDDQGKCIKKVLKGNSIAKQ